MAIPESGHNPYPYPVIAIDGPAASGKSTVSKRLAETVDVSYVNTGEMYRAITWHILENGIDPLDQSAILELLERTKIECGLADNRSYIEIDGFNPAANVRQDSINNHVSKISSIPQIRQRLVTCQRQLVNHGGLVMEGRDIGSVVFPDTPFKFYISASESIRQQRRNAEGQSDSIAERDRQDASRNTSPLIIAEGATVIDSSELSIEEVVKVIVAKLPVHP